jgi:hypothetical protein
MTKKRSHLAFSKLTVHNRRTAAHNRLQYLASGLMLLVGGCMTQGDPDLQVGEISSEISVYSAAQQGGCSTMGVLGLSRQIAAEIACTNPTLLAKFDQTANVKFNSSAVLPYLAPDAIGAVRRAATTAGTTIRINSGFRTVAQQYVLYEYFQQGRCVGNAAIPGRSNHESGRAVDVANWYDVVGPMNGRGWSHNVPNDEVHFDHLSSADIRGEDILAFQRLWNRNHPNDRIAEDGDYGPATNSRLGKSPGEGFAKGAICGNTDVTEPLPSPSEYIDDAEDEMTTENVPPAGQDPSQPDSAATSEAGCNTSRATGGWSLALSMFMMVVAGRRRSKQ